MKRITGVGTGLLASLLLTGALAAQVREGDQPQAPPAERAPEAAPEERDVVNLGGVVVTARRVEEVAQEVPIPIAVVDGGLIERSGAFNTHRLQQIVPTIQFFTSNPRNSFLNIRGQGLPFGLTNDGIEPGVGLYVDGVFYARPAAATLDFIDVERIEVLRGPQGTLYGKNTTAGALNVTTRVPSLTSTESIFELSTGNLGYVQVKGAVSTPIGQRLAGRLSFVSTEREGLLTNVRTNEKVNSVNNIGVKGQLRFLASDNFILSASADVTRQRPVGYAQVIAGVADLPHLAANRRYAAVAADLGYTIPSTDPYDRLIDHNSRWGAGQNLGGASLTADWSVGPGQLTSISAWRFWDWDPSNDRDWTGTDFIALSQAPSRHDQWSHELRYAAQVSPRVDFVAGLFGFRQALDAKTIEVQGKDSWRWTFNPSNSVVAATDPARLSALLDGRGQTAYADITTTSAALFGQVQWRVTDRLRLLPGIRFNYDAKGGSFEREVYGGDSDPELRAQLAAVNISLPGSAYYFDTDISDTNVSGQLTAGFALTNAINVYGTYATSFKTFGFNLSALPTVNGEPDLSTAKIDPEDVRHIEFGVKTSPAPGVTANLNVFSTDIRDFQTNVRDPDPTQPRAIVAGVELVRVRGAELDVSTSVNEHLAFHGALAYNDGQHVKFPNAIPPFELAGGPERVDISGSVLPGLPKWAGSITGEFSVPVGRGGADFVGGADANFRSEYSSSTTPSEYLNVEGYTLLNARAGIRLSSGWTISAWSRNLLNKDYLEQLGAAGSAGLYWGIPGEPRTFGVTARWQP